MSASFRKHASLALVSSVALNLAFWFALPGVVARNESTDFRDYYEPVARSLAAGFGFPVTDDSSLSYPPGFPLFLAAVYQISAWTTVPDTRALSAAMLLCMGVAALLVFLMGRHLWCDRLALLGALAWSTYPLNLWLAKQPNSEVPFLVLYYGAVYVVLREMATGKARTERCFVSGLLAGAAMLFRPLAIGLGAVLSLSILVSEKRRSRSVVCATALVAGTILAVLPWEAWMYAKTGRLILLSTNGPSSIADGLTYAVNKNYRVSQRPIPPEDVLRLMHEMQEEIRTHPDSLQSLHGMAHRLGPVLTADPIAATELLLRKGLRSWYATDSGRHELAILALQSGYGIFFVAAAGGCWLRGGAKRLYVVLAAVQVLYFWGMTVLGLSIVRYLVPATGLMFVMVPVLVHSRETHLTEADESQLPAD